MNTLIAILVVIIRYTVKYEKAYALLKIEMQCKKG